MRRSAFVVVVREILRVPHVLGVTRGVRDQDWSLPGGGVEPWEGWEEGAVRELLEETGVIAHPHSLALVQERPMLDRHVRYYALTSPARWPHVLRCEPFEGFVGLVEPDRLTTSTCTYRRENHDLLRTLGLI